MKARQKLTEEQKTFIKNNSHKFTALELANWAGVSSQAINSYCKDKKLKLKCGFCSGPSEHLDELECEDGMFDINKYAKNLVV